MSKQYLLEIFFFLVYILLPFSFSLMARLYTFTYVCLLPFREKNIR
jgi:hypothetical protein